MGLKCSLIFVTAFISKCFLVSDTTLIPDPCPVGIEEQKVVTMCENSNADEHEQDGSVAVDSVVLRMMQQKDDCVCQVEVLFSVFDREILQLRKYGDFVSTAPLNVNCGIEFDVVSIGRKQKQFLEPIKCLTGYSNREFTLHDRQSIRLTSKKTTPTNTLMSGYCLEFYRANVTESLPSILHISCFAPVVSNSTDTSLFSTNWPLSTADDEIDTTNQVASDRTMSTKSTFYADDCSTQTDNLLTSGISIPSNSMVIVVSVFAAVGWTIAIILLVFVVCGKRRRRKERKGTKGGNAPTNYEIPCIQGEISNYSNLNQMAQTEQQYEVITSSTH